jgi:glutathionylspermidine synthase
MGKFDYIICGVEDVTSKENNKQTPITILEGYIYEYNYKEDNQRK